MSTVRHTIMILADVDAPEGVDVQAFVDRWCQDVRFSAAVGVEGGKVGNVVNVTLDGVTVDETLTAFKLVGSIIRGET